MKKAPLAGAFFVVLLFLAGAVQADCRLHEYDETVRLDRVYDGDTVRLTDGRKVRLMGINTPERARDGRPDEPLSMEASQLFSDLLGTSRTLHLKYGPQRKDRHGRTLAHIFNADGKNAAAELIKQGMGFAIVVPPNTQLADCYFQLEKQAQQKSIGIWDLSTYQPIEPDKIQHTGFHVVEGKITAIGKGRKRLWLDMGKRFSVRLERRDLHYFDQLSVENLKNKRIRVRGWLSFYNHKFRMPLKHPLMMDILD